MRSATPRSRFPMTEREKFEGRLQAARANGGASTVTALGGDRYLVRGRNATYYVDAWVKSCTCPAGANSPNPCWHRAAVHIYLSESVREATTR